MAANTPSGGVFNFELVSLDTFVIQFIILLVVLWVLNKFVFKPYLAYLDEWEAKQKKVQEDYSNADALLEEKRKQGDVLLEDARSKGNSIIEEAETLAKTRQAKLVNDAELEAKDIVNSGKKQAENEYNSMLTNAKNDIMGMALKLNEKIMTDTKSSKDFMGKHIDSLK